MGSRDSDEAASGNSFGNELDLESQLRVACTGDLAFRFEETGFVESVVRRNKHMVAGPNGYAEFQEPNVPLPDEHPDMASLRYRANVRSKNREIARKNQEKEPDSRAIVLPKVPAHLRLEAESFVGEKRKREVEFLRRLSGHREQLCVPAETAPARRTVDENRIAVAEPSGNIGSIVRHGGVRKRLSGKKLEELADPSKQFKRFVTYVLPSAIKSLLLAEFLDQEPKKIQEIRSELYQRTGLDDFSGNKYDHVLKRTIETSMVPHIVSKDDSRRFGLLEGTEQYQLAARFAVHWIHAKLDLPIIKYMSTTKRGRGAAKKVPQSLAYVVLLDAIGHTRAGSYSLRKFLNSERTVPGFDHTTVVNEDNHVNVSGVLRFAEEAGMITREGFSTRKKEYFKQSGKDFSDLDDLKVESDYDARVVEDISRRTLDDVFSARDLIAEFSFDDTPKMGVFTRTIATLVEHGYLEQTDCPSQSIDLTDQGEAINEMLHIVYGIFTLNEGATFYAQAFMSGYQDELAEQGLSLEREVLARHYAHSKKARKQDAPEIALAIYQQLPSAQARSGKGAKSLNTNISNGATEEYLKMLNELGFVRVVEDASRDGRSSKIYQKSWKGRTDPKFEETFMEDVRVYLRNMREYRRK